MIKRLRFGPEQTITSLASRNRRSKYTQRSASSLTNRDRVFATVTTLVRRLKLNSLISFRSFSEATNVYILPRFYNSRAQKIILYDFKVQDIIKNCLRNERDKLKIRYFDRGIYLFSVAIKSWVSLEEEIPGHGGPRDLFARHRAKTAFKLTPTSVTRVLPLTRCKRERNAEKWG